MEFLIIVFTAFASYFIYTGFTRRNQTRAVKTAFQRRLEEFNRNAGIQEDLMESEFPVGNEEPGFLRRFGWELEEVLFHGRAGSSLLGLLEDRLETAGYPNGWHATDFAALWASLVGIIVILVGLIVSLTGFPVFLYLILTLLALFGPWIWLKQRINRRREQAFAELPYFLDEIILGLSSGATTLDTALRSVVMDDSLSEIRDNQRVLVLEFKRAYLEQANQSRPVDQAYRGAAERLKIQQVDDLVEVILEGYTTGSPILHILQDMSRHVYTIFEQNMATLIKKKDTPFTFATVIIMFSTAILIGTPIFLTVLKALSGGGF